MLIEYSHKFHRHRFGRHRELNTEWLTLNG
jgi:hypothetical protein